MTWVQSVNDPPRADERGLQAPLTAFYDHLGKQEGQSMDTWQLLDYADLALKCQRLDQETAAAWEVYNNLYKEQTQAMEERERLYQDLREQMEKERETIETLENRVSDEIKRAEEQWQVGYEYGHTIGYRSGHADACKALALASSTLAGAKVQPADPKLDQLLAEEEAIEQKHKESQTAWSAYYETQEQTDNRNA